MNDYVYTSLLCEKNRKPKNAKGIREIIETRVRIEKI